MTKSTAFTFVAGFACGAAGLMIALAIVPGVVSADGEPAGPKPQMLIEKQIAVLDRLNAWLDRTETALTRSAAATRENAVLQKKLAERSADMLDRAQGWMEQADAAFTESGREARQSALMSDLQTVRSQIELYKVQHGMYPGRTRTKDGTFTDWNGKAFVRQLITKTDVNGRSGKEAVYGPYLGDFPENPFASGNVASVVVGTEVEGDGAPGWFWDTDDAKFTPNDPGHAGQ